MLERELWVESRAHVSQIVKGAQSQRTGNGRMGPQQHRCSQNKEGRVGSLGNYLSDSQVRDLKKMARVGKYLREKNNNNNKNKARKYRLEHDAESQREASGNSPWSEQQKS